MKLTLFQDTLVHSNSELARLIAHEPHKAAAHYKRLSREAVQRGEFRDDFADVKRPQPPHGGVIRDPWGLSKLG